jgi:putative DNA primase/helicase
MTSANYWHYNYDNIPLELRAQSIWLRWKLETRDGKTTKLPYRSDGRGHAKTNDSTTWSTFILAASNKIGSGLGCVIRSPFVVIDLDKIRCPETGVIEPWAQEIIDECASYTEISPSKKGVHVWVRGSVPTGGNRKGRMEMYDENSPRYMTVTGETLNAVPIREYDLSNLHRRMLDGVDPLQNAPSRSLQPRGEIVDGKTDNSAADFSFCRKLAEQGKTAAEIDAAMRASSSIRPKWDEKRGSQTYGERTIASAMSGVVAQKRLIMNNAQQVKPEPISWLWKNKISVGKLTLFVGQPGVGKSFASMDIVARASSGRDWADSKNTTEPLRSIIVANEDDSHDTIVPRLLAMEADLSKIEIVEGAANERGEKTLFTLPEDVPALKSALDMYPDTKLVVIDPVMNHLGNTNSHKDQELRNALMPLVTLAAEKDIAIIVITHFNKNTSGNVLDKICGAVAMVGVARMAWAFIQDPETPGNKLMIQAKSNISGQMKGLSYSIQPASIEHEGQAIDSASLSWGKESNIDIDEAIAANSNPEERKTTRAKAWLQELFADGKERHAREVYEMGEKLHPPLDSATLKRTHRALGMKTQQTSTGWVWSRSGGNALVEGCSDDA